MSESPVRDDAVATQSLKMRFMVKTTKKKGGYVPHLQSTSESTDGSKTAPKPGVREHDYHVSAWWSSGRTGLVKADSSRVALHFSAPLEFGGMEGRWTPEELLLAALAGCYTTTLRALAAKAGLDLIDLQVEANASVARSQAGYAMDGIELRPSVRVAFAKEGKRALDLIHKAEKLCLISRRLSVPVKFIPQLSF